MKRFFRTATNAYLPQTIVALLALAVISGMWGFTIVSALSLADGAAVGFLAVVSVIVTIVALVGAGFLIGMMTYLDVQSPNKAHDLCKACGRTTTLDDRDDNPRNRRGRSGKRRRVCTEHGPLSPTGRPLSSSPTSPDRERDMPDLAAGLTSNPRPPG